MGAAGIGFYLYWFGHGGVKKEEKAEEEEEPYEMLYPLDTLNETLRTMETNQNILNRIVEEETPKGRIIMKYYEPDDTFYYWSDKSQDYKYLEVAARKYVILFNCKEVYVNMVDELVKEQKRKRDKVARQGSIENVGSSVFATFKQYTTRDSKKIANERANLYKWKGKLDEYISPDSASADMVSPNMSYSEYKNKL